MVPNKRKIAARSYAKIVSITSSRSFKRTAMSIATIGIQRAIAQQNQLAGEKCLFLIRPIIGSTQADSPNPRAKICNIVDDDKNLIINTQEFQVNYK